MAPGLLSDPTSVPDTPVRKTQSTYKHHQPKSGYYDLSSSSDELSEDSEAMRRLPGSASAHLPAIQTASSPVPYVTQPTQIIDKPARRLGSSQHPSAVVQVPASSPVQSPAAVNPQKSNILRPGGLLANALAPPGTAFRAPLGAQKMPPKAPVIDLSDDEPKYRGGDSSDEDISITRVVDITPTVFARGGHTYPGRNGTTEVTISTPSKRPADVMGSVSDIAGRAIKKGRQSGPLRANPVQEDLALKDVPDFNLRSKIQRIIDVFPSATVRICQNALHASKGNVEDAMLVVSDREQSSQIDQISTEHENTAAKISDSPIKRQVSAPSRSIHDKWATKNIAQGKFQNKSPQDLVQSITPVKKRKLVQRKNLQSKTTDESPRELSPPKDNLLEEDLDSDYALEAKNDTKTELRLLEFLNTCSQKDLQDFANTNEQTAELMISHRPFDNLDSARFVEEVSTTKSLSCDKKERVRRAVGDKIVDICLETWTGFEAVDTLVSQCEELGKPVADEIEAWGLDIFGTSKPSTLDLHSGDALHKNEKLGTQTEGDKSKESPPSSALGFDAKNPNYDFEATQQSYQPGILKPPIAQPAMMAQGFALKSYQIVGLNWLALLFRNGLSCILADEMGLGKPPLLCMVFPKALALKTGVKGPHLIVVPGSTLENWLREFSDFCPGLVVEPYYGNGKERAQIRSEILSNRDRISTVITTYDIAAQKKDAHFLRRDLKPVICVCDEAHVLRNSETLLYMALTRIAARFRILLTGTPLQNNLRELASLLAFIMPRLFKERKKDLQTIFKYKAKTTNSTHAALLSRQRITRAKAMLKPFILRRKKYEVLKDLPEKTGRVQYCELSLSQSEIYIAEVEEARRVVEDRAAGEIAAQVSTNVLMQLRKAAIHPLLFRRIFDDQKISEMAIDFFKNKSRLSKHKKWGKFEPEQLCEEFSFLSDFELHTLCEEYPEVLTKFNLEKDEWMDSGKVSQLSELLRLFKANGDRVLVFSQFVIVLDILEAVMETLNMQYSRLDGSTPVNERQDLIDQFQRETETTVFLLSTLAGGAGINLTAANKVVIFDSSFNPQQDVQAENRAHRLGQKRDVEVIRLVTRNTVEEDILSLGQAKLSLDRRVAGDEGLEDEKEKTETEVKRLLEEVMWKRIRG
ncbi:MAG: hypothetical protein M1812_003205 [Candelaria pacifica]|nr:MAG: hypothetical protein M1812_003205 [Candelaria pacifica]